MNIVVRFHFQYVYYCLEKLMFNFCSMFHGITDTCLLNPQTLSKISTCFHGLPGEPVINGLGHKKCVDVPNIMQLRASWYKNCVDVPNIVKLKAIYRSRGKMIFLLTWHKDAVSKGHDSFDDEISRSHYNISLYVKVLNCFNTLHVLTTWQISNNFKI